MSTRRPKAVSFDVGWTLVYPRESLWSIFAAVCQEAGASLSEREAEDLVHGMMTVARQHAVDGFTPSSQYSDSDSEFAAMFGLMSRMIFATAGVTDGDGELAQRFLQRFWNAENWVVFPEVRAAIERLRRHGVRVGVLSNASSDLLGFLERLGLSSQLDFAVVSAVEGTKKPDRRIYELTLRRAGTRPEETVHVGDMYLEDILGARNVGVTPLLIERGPQAMFPNHRESAGLAESVDIVCSLDDVLAAFDLG